MGLPEFRAHREDPDRSERRQHRLRLRAGQAVERLRRSRPVQDQRRRQELERWCSRARICRPAARRSVSIRPRPRRALAGLWDFRRKGWTFRSGGDAADAPSGSGLFRSDDGGQTWTEVSDSANKGFPKKPWGRIAVAIAPSAPKVVYAFVESTDSALYRSDDGGKTWDKRDKSQMMVWRPFYFASLIVDPKNPDRLFKPDLALIQSLDGGKSFANVGGGAHGDWHDVWIDPTDTAARDRRRRRRPVAVVRRRQPLVEGEQPAGLAVLSRQRRQRRSVPRLRRPAGQQLLGRRLRVSGRHHQLALGEHVRRRRLLDVRRSGRSRLHLRRSAGRHDRSRQSPHASSRATSSPRPATTRSCASTGTRRSRSARTRRARSTSARSSCSARAITARPGSASRRI